MSRDFVKASSHRLTYAGAVVSATPLTIAGWFWANDVTQNFEILGITDFASAATRYGIELRGAIAGDFIQATTYNGSSLGVATTSAGYIANAWQHVVAVFTSPTSRAIYLNGGNVGTDTTNVTDPPGLNVTTVGCWGLNSTYESFLDGKMAEVAVWSAALDAAEIAALAKGFSPFLIRPQPLVAYWPLYGNDSPEPDRWKNRFDLTVTGATKADHPRIYLPTSAKAIFAIAVAPATPNTPSPADGATSVAPAALTWVAAGATSYDVYFGTSVTPPLVSSGQAGASYTPTLADGTTYYWKIVAINATGSTTGPVWSFTAAKPGTPSSPSPANGAIGQGAHATLAWAATGATSYDVYFGTSASPPLISSGQPGTTYDPGTLASLQTYYWKIVAINPAGSTTGSIWSFQTLSLTALVMTVGGVTPHTRMMGIEIRDLLNDAPNTCSFTVDGTAPTVGQDIQIGLGSLAAADLIFAGTIETVAQFYEGGKATRPAWRVTCRDYTGLLNQLKVRKRYAQQSATAIALDLAANYAPGFTTDGIVIDLPTVEGGIDFTEDEPGGAFARLAARIGGYSKTDYGKVLSLFLTDTSAPPDDVVPGPPLLNDPPVTTETDRTQLRTRNYVEGGGANALATTVAGTPVLAVEDDKWYIPTGGMVVSGPQRITYGGVVAGGAGALVGTTVTPTNGPAVTGRATTGLTAGLYYWAATFTTGSGETTPSPVTSVTLGGAVPGPVSAPTVARLAGGSLTVGGVYKWKISYLTAVGETASSAESASFTIDAAASNPATIGPFGGGQGDPASQLSTGYGTYQWCFTFRRLADGAETDKSPERTVTGEWVSNTYVTIQLGNASSAPPSGFVRQFYRTALNGSVFKRVPQDGTLVIGVAPQGTDYGGYFYDHASDASLGAELPASNNTAYGSATLGIPVSPEPLVTSVRIMRTLANTSTFKIVAHISNGTTSYTDTVADGSLVDIPGGASALYLAANLTSIPIGPSGTTGRKVYRTVVNGAQLKLLTSIANNSGTTFTDTTPDGSLGANAPTSDTSGLVSQSGEVAAGSTSLAVTSTAPFQSSGGWAFIGALPVRYTGFSGTALTGVPASGVGALTTTVRYGVEIVAAPMLTGIPTSGAGSILYDILAGDPVNILEICDDAAAQAIYGVIEHYIQDRRLARAEARATGNADLALFSRPIVTVRYATHDPNTESGKTVHIDIPALGILGDFIIQSVTIDQIGVAPNVYPRYTVEASTVRFSFEDMLRRLRLAA